MAQSSTFQGFLKAIYRIWITERPNRSAAALAYYGMFSFAPVIFIAFTVAGIFVDQLAVANQTFERLAQVVGPEVAAFVQDTVAGASQPASSGSILGSIIGFLALFYAASGLFYQIQFALNTIWKVPPPESGETLKFIKQRLFTFVMVIGVGLLLILASMASVVLSWFGSLFNLDSSLPIANALAFWGLVTLSFALIYKVLPEVKVAWREVWIGAAIAAFLITIGAQLLIIFFQLGIFHSAFAAAGAFAIVLTGMYYIAQIFLLGAVITRVSASMYGSKRAPD